MGGRFIVQRAVYAILAHIAFLLLVPVLLFHPKLRGHLCARLGFPRPSWPGPLGRPLVWFHGASAGDLKALLPTVQALREHRPDCGVLLTTVTRSGLQWAERNRKALGAACSVLPWDLPWAVGRVMRRVRPDALVLEYAELWPGLISAARRTGARVVVQNGRLHPDRIGRYRALYRLVGSPLRSLDLYLARDDEEAGRALCLGAPRALVRTTGNTKYDAPPPPADAAARLALARALGASPERIVLVAGSTHAGEEELLLRVFGKLRAARAELLLVVAPRYPERAPRIAALSARLGLSAGLRSAGVPPGTAVALLDTIGELGTAYHMAEVAIVGGSFVRRGGQSLIEPAACGKPVVFGPNVWNFADAARRLAGRGGIQVQDERALEEALARLLADPTERERLGGLARQAFAALGGAAQANAAAIATLLAEARL